MTADADVLTRMLDQAGVRYRRCDDPSHVDGGFAIEVRVDDNRRGGYQGFVTEFVFDRSGSLRNVFAWE